jgi:hypothetical protein
MMFSVETGHLPSSRWARRGRCHRAERWSCVWPEPIHGSEAISDAFKKLLEGKDPRMLLIGLLATYVPIFEANRGINATAEQ